MGIFKQFRDMANVVAVAPQLVDQARQMQVQAQAYSQAAGQATWPAFAGTSTIDPTDPRLAPIAGVSLLTYIRVVKGAAEQNLGADAVVARAASLGAARDAWQQAAYEWPARMRNDLNLATHYGTLYGRVVA